MPSSYTFTPKSPSSNVWNSKLLQSSHKSPLMARSLDYPDSSRSDTPRTDSSEGDNTSMWRRKSFFSKKIIVFNQLNLILLLSTYYFSIAFVLVFERRIKISFYAKNQSKRVLWLIACFAFACNDFAKKITFTYKKTPLTTNCLSTH